ncbi:GbsR/MarR family transcriptional regulator [Gryllotalpicola protaetiae]|uniref:MarR family transcriptional regulator n=1 Tax=Gryllotalpicola protaetiae TaxID=2419771 RepID=A0A387BRH0_9MICO|nr:MarR family transcriptional regulator [Gryllotalpicola protaetiae]AYG03659.1 MarR family transcriptional regulator [Gryllotalpicola protaetiae]
MPARADALQEHAERLAALFTVAGFPRMASRVLMTLMMSTDAALTAVELKERLGISAAAVSGAVKYLERLGMVRRRAHRGSRKELYELPEAAWYTASLRQPPFYAEIAALLPDGILAAQQAEAAGPLARLVEMQEFFEFMRTRMPGLYEEWVATRAAEVAEREG